MTERTPCDLLVTGDHVLPITAGDPVLDDAAVAVVDGVIQAVGPRAELVARWDPGETLSGGIVLPGLVNTHGHAGMTLYRGLGDDMPLMTWLEQFVWPAEKQFTTEENVRTGTELAIAEMLASGTTAFADMYFYPERAAEVAAETGIRMVVGMIAIEFPTPWSADAAECISKGLAVHDACRSRPLINTMFAPHAPYTVADTTLKRIRQLADELEVPVQMHVHETVSEVEQAVIDRVHA